MRKLPDGTFKPSPTDIKRAQAHLRAMAKYPAYDGSIELWFNRYLGKFRYIECVGSNYTVCEDDSNIYISSVTLSTMQ